MQTDQTSRHVSARTEAMAAQPERTVERTRPYLDQLNGVRLATSIGVVATHCTEQFGVGSSIYSWAVLSELHATREVFFVVSALVLSYRHYDTPIDWNGFFNRRLRWIVLPYLVWTFAYFGLSYGHIGRFSLFGPSGSMLDQIHQMAVLSVTGIGHLYYVAMLLQLYALFPLFVWFLHKTAPVHVLVVVASIAIQVWLMSRVAQSVATNRELWNYQVYLVVGGVAGAHFHQVSHWLWRLRRLLAVLIAAVLVTTEIQFVATVHSGVGVGAASDPFQARFIATNLAMALGLYLVGCWWVRRPRPPVLRNLVKSGSDNSFGVYLCHGVALNLLIHWGYGARLEAHMRWEYAALIAVVIVWTAAATFCAAVARTPLAPAVGRVRRPLWHGPARGRAEPAEPLGAVA